MSMAFDMLRDAQRLRHVGISREQAGAHAELARDMLLSGVATKADLATLGREIESKLELGRAAHGRDARRDDGSKRRIGRRGPEIVLRPRAIFIGSGEEPMAAFALYDVVRILGKPIPDDLPPDDRPPVGDYGTVVDIVEDGAAYVVEVAGEDGTTEWLGRLKPEEMELAGRPETGKG